MASLLRLPARGPVLTIDLGTAFVRVGTPGEPVCVERSTVIPGARHPAMRGGVVHDIDAAASVLVAAVSDSMLLRRRRARVLVSVPATATSVERHAVHWTLERAGIRSDTILIDEPLAAAVGLGLDIADERPHLVIDVGHGVTEAAVVASGAIRALRGVRVGCAQLDDERTSRETLEWMAHVVVDALGELRPDEAAAIEVAHVVGGGSLSRAVQERIARATNLPIRLCPHPLHAVARGDAICAVESFRRRTGRSG